jgi:hypothetical protein
VNLSLLKLFLDASCHCEPNDLLKSTKFHLKLEKNRFFGVGLLG